MHTLATFAALAGAYALGTATGAVVLPKLVAGVKSLIGAIRQFKA